MLRMKQRNRMLGRRWVAYHFPLLRFLAKERDQETMPLEPSEVVLLDCTLPRVPVVGLVQDLPAHNKKVYWTKYARFFTNNQIPYRIVSVQDSDWLDQVGDLDMLIWRPLSRPAQLAEAKNKLYALESYLDVFTVPSYRDIWMYEDKLNQYYALKMLGLPVVDTFVSHSLKETLSYLEQAVYPLVWKISSGSGSLGVSLMLNRRKALRAAKKVFSPAGRWTYWGYERQKDYVYLQRFIPGGVQDVRVIVAEDRFLGLMRSPDQGDFRASGSGNIHKEALPVEAMLLAREVRLRLKTDYVVVDMLYSMDSKRYEIIEVSLFTSAFSQEQLMVDGVAGYYRYQEGAFVFVPGRVWVQELMLLSAMRRWAERKEISL